MAEDSTRCEGHVQHTMCCPMQYDIANIEGPQVQAAAEKKVTTLDYETRAERRIPTWHLVVDVLVLTLAGFVLAAIVTLVALPVLAFFYHS